MCQNYPCVVPASNTTIGENEGELVQTLCCPGIWIIDSVDFLVYLGAGCFEKEPAITSAKI